jgi:hypothetical protein
MRLRITTLAPVLVVAALLPAATAAAAPNRTADLATEGAKFTWSTDVATGAVYTSDVSSRVPACSPVFSCDATLIKTDVLGNLQLGITGKGVNDQDTLKDVDLHVYLSDAEGTQGELWGESAGASADEAYTVENAEPGYYLVVIDWYLGVGSVDGTAELAPPTPPEEETA